MSDACSGLELLGSSLGWSWAVNILIRQKLYPLIRDALHAPRGDVKCELGGADVAPDLGCHVVTLLGSLILLAPARDHAYEWLRAQLLAILRTAGSALPLQLRAAVALLQSLEVPTAAPSISVPSGADSGALTDGTGCDDAAGAISDGVLTAGADAAGGVAAGGMSDDVVVGAVSWWARADVSRVGALRRLGVISQAAWAALDASMNASMSTCA